MNDDNYRGDDLISRPPAGAVLVRKIGSWNILFSHGHLGDVDTRRANRWAQPQ